MSSVLVSAAGAWTILSLPAQISQRRFPRSMWTLTTSLAVQANYLGWLLGAIIPPAVAKDAESLERLCLVTAIVSTPLVVAFFALYRAPTRADVQWAAAERQAASESALSQSFRDSYIQAVGRSRSGQIHAEQTSIGGKFYELFLVSKLQPRFVIQILAIGLLGGLSFAQPSASIFILQNYGFSNRACAFVNAAFLGFGVVFGLVLGRFCNEPKRFGVVLKVLFFVCAACLGGCVALTYFGYLNGDSFWSLIAVLSLSAGIGMSSLGFIGIGIEATALYPAGAGHVCWAIEIIMQGVGGALNKVAADAEGFTTLLVVAIVAFLLIIVGYRLPKDD